MHNTLKCHFPILITIDTLQKVKNSRRVIAKVHKDLYEEWKLSPCKNADASYFFREMSHLQEELNYLKEVEEDAKLLLITQLN